MSNSVFGQTTDEVLEHIKKSSQVRMNRKCQKCVDNLTKKTGSSVADKLKKFNGNSEAWAEFEGKKFERELKAGKFKKDSPYSREGILSPKEIDQLLTATSKERELD